MIKKTVRFLAFLFICGSLILLGGLLIPQDLMMPVEGADASSYNKNSFWFYPWGKSLTHKGVDIFAPTGTPVKASTNGIVMYKGRMGRGGNIVLILGPKWRVHYYAHLNEIKTSRYSYCSRNELIGTVGTTGNAAGKPAHLHYAIATPIPYPWLIDLAPQGYLKMFYLNPIDYF